MQVAAFFVNPEARHGLDGVDLWDEARDASTVRRPILSWRILPVIAGTSLP